MINAALVKQLRDITDAGMMDCKKALVEVNGDIDKAIEYLRQKGLSKAAKKTSKVAAEGLIALKVEKDLSKAALVEINSETDFVAKNENFRELSLNVMDSIFNSEINELEELKNLNIQNQSFENYLHSQIAKIGENIVIRKLSFLKANEKSIVNGYLHSNERVGVLVVLGFKNESSKEKLEKLSKNICMHAAAMKPKIISYKEFDLEFVENEKKALKAEIEKENEELKRLQKPLKKVPEFISRKELTKEVLENAEARFKEDLKAQKKPEAIWDRILPGMIDRFISDNTLLDQRLTLEGQFFVMDDKKTIKDILDIESKNLNDEISILQYIRFELGEGIQKEKEDFAKAVAAQMQ